MPSEPSPPPPMPPPPRRSVVVELEAHAIVDLVVIERDVVLVHRVPFLYPQFLWPRARLRSEELLEVAHGVVGVAFDADLLAEAILADHLDHRLAAAPPTTEG